MALGSEDDVAAEEQSSSLIIAPPDNPTVPEARNRDVGEHPVVECGKELCRCSTNSKRQSGRTDPSMNWVVVKTIPIISIQTTVLTEADPFPMPLPSIITEANAFACAV